MGVFRNATIAIFFFVSILAAQGVRATIVGRITDDTGAVVPGAKITIGWKAEDCRALDAA